jgi:hypothetical protein
MAGQHWTAILQKEVREVIKAAGSRDAGVERAKRSRCGISGIGETVKTSVFPFVIQAFERAARHHDFTSHLERLFAEGISSCAKRKRSYGARVLCNVLAGAAISSRDGLRQAAI